MSRIWMFRLVACGIPSIIGLVVLVMVAKHRQVLVVDDGEIKLQAPPLYVQEPGHEKTGHKYLYDSQLGWRNIANWNASTFGHELTTNSKNLRDREYEFQKPAGAKRILVLGDSFAWGYGVANRDIFTEVLEARFARDQTPYEVINTGVSGWGTDQEFLYFADEGVKYSPDVVVLAFYLGNDPVNCSGSIQYGLHKPVFVDMDLTLANVPVPKPTDESAQEITASADRHSLAVRIIEEIAKTCDSIDAEFVLMKFGVFQRPNHGAVRQANQDFEAKLDRIRDSIRYLDLDAEFQKHGLSFTQLTEGVDDGHWNVFGHQMVADILREFLAANSLIQ
ncbi:MAG: SGNH/GDSL hydrolase family protein [Planctomycetales bacterium]|nr:SGNH/GDSL hydrolase family protein [Planctomycetales bacterium]